MMAHLDREARWMVALAVVAMSGVVAMTVVGLLKIHGGTP